eukprot:8342235-Pyramimonas_sp.AAC.2
MAVYTFPLFSSGEQHLKPVGRHCMFKSGANDHPASSGIVSQGFSPAPPPVSLDSAHTIDTIHRRAYIRII